MTRVADNRFLTTIRGADIKGLLIYMLLKTQRKMGLGRKDCFLPKESYKLKRKG